VSDSPSRRGLRQHDRGKYHGHSGGVAVTVSNAGSNSHRRGHAARDSGHPRFPGRHAPKRRCASLVPAAFGHRPLYDHRPARNGPQKGRAVNRIDIPRERERQRRWRAANPEKVREQNRRRNTSPAGRASRARWEAENPRKIVDKGLRYRYGISLDDYEALLTKQGGVCAICLRPETATRAGTLLRLHVDHDHATRKVRGLLCNRCNRMLGVMGEDAARLRRAADYLDGASAALADRIPPSWVAEP
jgi:hypothetical protein